MPPEGHFEQKRSLRRYGAAVGIVLAAALLRLMLLPGLGMGFAFITFYPAVMLAALYGGLRAGVLATVLSGLTADYFWMEPTGTFAIANPIDWLALSIFGGNGLLVSWVAEKVHQSKIRRQQAEASRRVELERLVAERTTELTNEIAERKRAEAASAQLAAIVTSSSDAILSKTLEGAIISWNAGAARIFGFGAEEMVGQSITRLFPPERIDEESEILARLGRGERIEHYETLRRTRDGGDLDVSLTISPIRDANGAVVGASKIIRDISERKRAEEALRESEHRLRRVYDFVAAGPGLLERERRHFRCQRQVPGDGRLRAG